MTVFTDEWNAAFEADPADSDEISTGAADIRQLALAVRERLEVDHSWDGDANDGEHKKVTFEEQAADPTTVADTGYIYTKETGGKSELFWKDEDANVVQLTALGKLSTDIPVSAKTGAYTVVAADKSTLINATSGTWTLALTAAATLGDGFWFVAKNPGSGTITIDPDGAELIDGSATISLAQGQGCFVICDGAAFITIGLAASTPTITFGTDLTQNPSATSATVTQAHGLSAEPTGLKAILECLTGEHGYTAGNRYDLGASMAQQTLTNGGIALVVDATNVVLITGQGGIRILHKTSYTSQTITAANWKIVVSPYLLVSA